MSITLLDARPRHPEKAHRPDNPIQRKPAWIRAKAPGSPGYMATQRAGARAQARHRLRGGALPQYRRVLGEEARDVHDHGRDLHARLRLLQRRDRPAACARRRRARARRRRCRQARPGHVVVTSVDRDDLADGGAAHFAEVIRAIRAAAPATTIEVLTPDFLRKDGALEIVIAAQAGRVQPQPRNRAGQISLRAARARATSTRSVSCSASRSSTQRCSPSRASWSASARPATKCCR